MSQFFLGLIRGILLVFLMYGLLFLDLVREFTTEKMLIIGLSSLLLLLSLAVKPTVRKTRY